MLKLPNCDFCKHRLDGANTCRAYPDGIPLEAMLRAEKGVECNAGFSFAEEKNVDKTEVKQDGLLNKLIDIIGD